MTVAMKTLAISIFFIGIFAVASLVSAKSSSLACSPWNTETTAGTPITITASGGSGNYTWSATGGTPASGTGSSFTTSFPSDGVWAATVTDPKRGGGNSITCFVTIGTTLPRPGPIL